MGWRFTEDVEEYARAAGPLLAARPAEHTVSLTVVENARAQNAAAAERPGSSASAPSTPRASGAGVVGGRR